MPTGVTLPRMTDHKTVYQEGCERVTALALRLDEAQLASPLPACPGWTVRSAVAHVTGVLDDALAGNVEGVGSDAWTQAQIDKRADASIEDIVAEWRSLTEQAAPVFEQNEGPLTASLIGDFATHEHDLRGGLANREARDTDAVAVALEWYARQFTKKVEGAGLPPVKVAAPGAEWVRGGGEAAATVTADAFTLLRSLTGRRTQAEVAALDWQGDPTPYLGLVSFYGWPEEPLGE